MANREAWCGGTLTFATFGGWRGLARLVAVAGQALVITGPNAHFAG